jgi:hypothetical protein
LGAGLGDRFGVVEDTDAGATLRAALDAAPAIDGLLRTGLYW